MCVRARSTNAKSTWSKCSCSTLEQTHDDEVISPEFYSREQNRHASIPILPFFSLPFHPSSSSSLICPLFPFCLHQLLTLSCPPLHTRVTHLCLCFRSHLLSSLSPCASKIIRSFLSICLFLSFHHLFATLDRQTGTNIRSHIERKTPIPLGCSHIKLIFHVTSCVILSSINDFNNPNTSVFKFNVFVRRCVSENNFNQGLLSRWYTYVHQHANLEIIHFLNLHRDECKQQQQKQDDDYNIVDIFTFVSTCG